MSSRLCNMPPELLGEMFSQLARLDPDSPFSLRSVCRTFYNVVRRTPKIWTHLKLDVSPDSIEHCLAKSHVWFSMAGDCKVWVEAELIEGYRNKNVAGDIFSEKCQELPLQLSAYASQISSISFTSASPEEAGFFLAALYDNATPSSSGHPLQFLSLTASPDAASRRPSRSKTMSPISLPSFPHLRQLTLTNHLLPYLSTNNSQNLQVLSLAYPLRFPPLSIFDLRHVLQSSPQLTQLELDARITDSPNSSSFPDVDTAEEDASTNTDLASQPHSQSRLISMPNLTHLHLRINNLPLLLGELLMQNLDTLKIEDLDGKRARADAESGGMLRQLLVRMELPSEDKRGQGLRSLELVGVSIPTSVSRYEPDGSGSGPVESDAFGTWSWCFHRMRTLNKLRVRKVNTQSLLALIIGTSTATSLPTSLSYARDRTHDVSTLPMPLDDRLALPSLESLDVTLSASASGFNAPAFLKLAMQRPNLNVHVDVVPDPPPMVGDFLAHYLS